MSRDLRYPEFRCSRCGLYGCEVRYEGHGVDFYYCPECLPKVIEENGWRTAA